MKSKKAAVLVLLMSYAVVSGCGKVEEYHRVGDGEPETLVTDAEDDPEEKSSEKFDESSEAEDERVKEEVESSQMDENSEDHDEPSKDDSNLSNSPEDTSDLADFDVDLNEDDTVSEYYSQSMLPVPIEDMQKENLKSSGVVSCDILGPTKRGDMVLKTTFTEEGYDAYSSKMKAEIKESLDEMFRINRFNSVTSVSYNDDFTDFYIYVTDADTFYNGTGSGEYFNGKDKEKCYSLIEEPMTQYHVYNLDDDDVTITMHFIDDSGTEFLTDEFDDEDRSVYVRRDE